MLGGWIVGMFGLLFDYCVRVLVCVQCSMYIALIYLVFRGVWRFIYKSEIIITLRLRILKIIKIKN